MPGEGGLIARAPNTQEARKGRKWLWPKHWPEAGAVIVDGDSGTGKTRAIASALYHADGKGLMPDGFNSDVAVNSIIHMSGEMDDTQVYNVWSSQGWEDTWLEANLRIMHSVRGSEGQEYDFTLDNRKHVAALGELITDFKANVVIMDPFIEFYGGDENNAHNARHYVRLCQELGLAKGCLFILVIHWNKNEEVGSRNRMSGSHQLTATARARTTIIPQKANPDRKTWHLEKHIEEGQPDLYFEIDEYGSIEWVRGTTPKHSQATVDGWLEGRLGDKAGHFITDIRDEAQTQHGYDRWQVKRAREHLGAKIINEFQQNGVVKKETWRLL